MFIYLQGFNYTVLISRLFAFVCIIYYRLFLTVFLFTYLNLYEHIYAVPESQFNKISTLPLSYRVHSIL
jgi:hypothetical protein